ncbi:hypothetical protein A8139_11965 [Marinomonas primoryensis]|uniref:Uncharacterized protein n=1 Tax=Marinomonas primoryensis TaxID=178399 RepID=A0A2Z4PSR4_9GAMM|nr:hypothetical protein [Marinomonas primoryensis]AWY00621.1 hypothetical protein A8139_11965 [Marinomonas primoryensis]
MKIIKAVIAAYYWSKSISLSSSEKYEEALDYLKKTSKFRKVFDEEFFLHQGFLLGSTGHSDSSIKSLKKAIEYSMSEKSKLNIDEKIYLKNYATMIASFLDVHGVPFQINDAYNTNNVSSHLKEKFRYKKSLVKI